MKVPVRILLASPRGSGIGKVSQVARIAVVGLVADLRLALWRPEGNVPFLRSSWVCDTVELA